MSVFTSRQFLCHLSNLLQCRIGSAQRPAGCQFLDQRRRCTWQSLLEVLWSLHHYPNPNFGCTLSSLHIPKIYKVSMFRFRRSKIHWKSSSLSFSIGKYFNSTFMLFVTEKRTSIPISVKSSKRTKMFQHIFNLKSIRLDRTLFASEISAFPAWSRFISCCKTKREMFLLLFASISSLWIYCLSWG